VQLSIFETILPYVSGTNMIHRVKDRFLATNTHFHVNLNANFGVFQTMLRPTHNPCGFY
jgi:hypothetical protein